MRKKHRLLIVVAPLLSAAASDHPFVEPVRFLHEWRGEAPNDQFGWIARNLGDVTSATSTALRVRCAPSSPAG